MKRNKETSSRHLAFFLAMTLAMSSALAVSGCGGNTAGGNDKPISADGESGQSAQDGDAGSSQGTGSHASGQDEEELLDAFKGDSIDWINRDPFADLPGIGDIYEDIRDFDLYAEMDTEGLTETEKVNEADSTSIIEYRGEDNELVYTKYVGYGEECYDAYVKGRSGRNLILRYTDIEGARMQVDVYAHDYTLNMQELNPESEYGADRIFIYQNGTEGMLLPESRIMELYQNHWFVSSTYAFTAEGYTHYTAWWEDDSLHDKTILVWENRGNVPECGSEILNLGENQVIASFSMGEQTFFYSGNTQGPWYMTAVYHLIFDSSESAEAFAEPHGLEAEEIIDGFGDAMWIVDTPEITLPISSDCENFIDVATREVDDSYIMDVVIDADGEIVAFTDSALSIAQ